MDHMMDSMTGWMGGWGLLAVVLLLAIFTGVVVLLARSARK